MGLRNLHSIVESNIGRSITRLVGRIHAWDEGFGPGDLNASAAKMVEEALELLERPQDLSEAADILIVLLAWLRPAGYSLADLIAAATRKQIVNENRTWETGPDGVRRHVE